MNDFLMLFSLYILPSLICTSAIWSNRYESKVSETIGMTFVGLFPLINMGISFLILICLLAEQVTKTANALDLHHKK